MKSFVGKLNLQLNIQLEKIEMEESNILKRSLSSTRLIENSLNVLRDFVSDYEFSDPPEEVLFFKELKPALFSKLIYFVELYNIECRKLTASKGDHENYYRQELDRISSFYTNNFEFYQYYRMESTHFDDKYFVRGNDNMLLYRDSQMYFIDKEFSTSYDAIVAKILAYDRIQVFLNNEIDSFSKTYTNTHVGQMGLQSNFQWTESKTALVELIYALSASGALNNGNCEIKELVAMFEKCFNVRLPEVYRTFSGLKIRSEQTKFIDSLKASLIRKMEDDF